MRVRLLGLGALGTILLASAWGVMHFGAGTLEPGSELRRHLPGRWQGAVGAGEESTVVFLDIDTLAGNRWVSEADIPAQDVHDFPLGLDLVGDTLRFELSRAGSGGPELRLTLPAAGAPLTGRFLGNDGDEPARFVRIGPPEISDALAGLTRESASALAVTVLSPDARELRAHFNAHADRVRLVVLLSPT